MTTPAHRADVVVIGAGIVGAACAATLSGPGLEVMVCEAREAPATGSTGRSLAGVRVQFASQVNIEMSLRSIAEYRGFRDRHGIDVGYDPIGYLLLVPHDAWDDHLQAVALQQQAGARVDVLSLDQATRFTKFSSDGLAGATFGPDDGTVDPHAATMAYLQLAKARGAEVRMSCEVLGIEPTGEGWTVRTTAGEVCASSVVNAAGAWAGRVAALAGLAVPVQPLRVSVFATAPVARPRRSPLVIDVDSGFYFRGEGDRLLFGLTRRGNEGVFDQGIDWPWLDTALSVGAARFPWLPDEQLDRRACWWGYYEVTPDHAPIIGHMPGAPGWVNACGFSGHGVMHAPATGQLVMEEIVDGQAHSIDLTPLRYERLVSSAAQPDSHLF